jgi:hypothetical protein
MPTFKPWIGMEYAINGSITSSFLKRAAKVKQSDQLFKKGGKKVAAA